MVRIDGGKNAFVRRLRVAWPFESKPCTRNALGAGLSIVLAAVMTLTVPAARVSVSAADPIACSVTEVTFTTGGSNGAPSISSAGGLIAFASDRDLVTGDNVDGNSEVFLYDTAKHAFTQVTETTGGHNVNPSLSGDGNWIALRSNRDLENNGENVDGNTEIFLYDVTTKAFTQVTNSAGAEGGVGFPVNGLPAVNENGTRIAFASGHDLLGSNADTNSEIYLWVSANGTSGLSQITNGADHNQIVSISDAGTRIAFENISTSSFEVLVYDTTTQLFTPATSTNGTGTTRPFINGGGTRIGFHTDKYVTGNPDGNSEIYFYDITTGATTQVTSTTGGNNHDAMLSGDGSRVLFRSPLDLTGGNADGSPELFLVDIAASTLVQVTNGGGLAGSVNNDGSLIAFTSTSFGNLGNADGNNEIFLARCAAPPPPASADVLVSLGVDKPSVKQGDKVTYTLTVKNFGPDAASNVVANNVLSSGTTFVSAQANMGAFTAPPAGQTGTVSWNVGTLAKDAQESAQIRVTVIIRGRTTITNTATVTADAGDPNTANNTASITVAVGSGTSGPKK